MHTLLAVGVNKAYVLCFALMGHRKYEYLSAAEDLEDGKNEQF